MRRIVPLLLSVYCLSVPGCTKPPKPEGAKKQAKAEGDKKSDDAKASKKAKSVDAKPADNGLGELLKGPVAKVGDVDVSNASFRDIYDLKVKKYADRGRKMPKSADRRYRKSITERLIYQEVLRQEAEAKGVDFDAAELDAREAQQKKGIRDWERHLARRGESDASLKEMWIRELRERALLDHSGVLKVTDAEVDEEYEKVKNNYKKDKERVRAAHILVRVGPKDTRQAKDASEADKKKWDAEAKAKADAIYKLVKAKGADFDAIAREKSEGPSAAKGGDLGIFSADRMVKEFSDAAFKLGPGKVSKPVRTKFGYHIIKVNGKYPPGLLPKEALVDQLRSRLEARKLIKSRRELKEKLLESHKVVNHMEPTLGPDPRERRAKRKIPPHGHGGGDKAKAADHGHDGDKAAKGHGH